MRATALAYDVYAFVVCLLVAAHAAKLKRVWLQDHCQSGICTGVMIGRNDYVILAQAPINKQLLLTFINSSIAKIPHLMFDTFPDLQVLRMDNCSVETFEKPQFEGASNLLSLFLSHNLLHDIPKSIFLGADNLNTLTLDYNKLRTLHNGSFNALKELRELSLAGNQLDTLALGTFAPLRKLLALNLAHNHLELFPRGIFDKNLNLTRVNLAYNRFKVFESALLRQQPRLSLLDLSGNELQELTLNFSQLDSVAASSCDLRRLTVYGIVHELDLRNNSLRELPHVPLAANVTSLDMSQNPLAPLDGEPLRRYTQLLRLNLSSTRLHDMPENVLKQQTRLQMLDISNNSIYSLKIVMFDALKALQYFYFQQNNWNCDFLQLLMNSFVKKRDISFGEDVTAPELVDDFVDGIACWYESNQALRRGGEGGIGGGRGSGVGGADAALELSIVRNDIKGFMEAMDMKFVKVYRLLEEIKQRI